MPSHPHCVRSHSRPDAIGAGPIPALQTVRQARQRPPDLTLHRRITIMSRAIDRTTTSRRRLLAGTGMAAIAAALALPVVVSPVIPTTSPDHPDAALLATCATFAELTASIHRINAGTACDWDELTTINLEWHDTLEDLSDMRPTTPAGIQAKARAAIAAFELDVPSGIGSTVEEHAQPHEYAAWRLFHDVVQMGAVA